MQKKTYTPKEILKVVKEILETQQANGYKAGWVYHEMTKRAEKAEARGGSFYGVGMNSHDLANHAHYIARGDNDIGYFEEVLRTGWEMYQEAVTKYA